MENSKNISVLAREDCCGCRTCWDVCPVNCISFKEDKEGFFYPSVDESICISCSKCQRTCPEINPSFYEKADMASAAYANSEEARKAGSSGGVFGLLAQEVLSAGGHVYGAAFDDNLKLVHRCATNVDELVPLMKSKYLQSNTSGSFVEVLKDVRSGRITLFAGTPCQCNAIRNAVGTKNDNLITVEVVCHGVPSQNLFDKTIAWIESKYSCRVRSFSFRSKYKNALHPQAFSYECLKNGKLKTVNGLHYQNPFYFGFQKYITLRPSCYRCKWARPERSADITLGDFWGIEKYIPSLDAKTGISQVIVNTEKGKKFFVTLEKKGLIWHEDFPIEVAIENNGCLKSPTRLKPERELLFKALESESFDEVVNRHLKSKRQWIFDLYYGMPGFLRRIVRKLMDKRMKYE